MAQAEFSSLRINDENQVVFTAQAEAPSFNRYSTGFLSKPTEKTLEQLSFFPEELLLLPNSQSLQIQNRFGLFRTGSDFTGTQPVERSGSFIQGGEIQIGKIDPMIASPDGLWIAYVKPTSPAFGNLVLLNLETQKETVISNRVERDLNHPEVVWSPKSDFFVYHKGNSLFYLSIEQHNQNRMLSESYRRIGAGQMSNIRWGRGNELYYITGSLVYQILGVEFFTRSLYQEFLKIGRIVGKIPFSFDPSFDRFWISPDGSQILLDKGGRNIYLYFLQNNDYTTTGSTIELPYLYLPRNSRVDQVIWSSAGVITLLTKGIAQGSISTSLYTLDVSQPRDSYSFEGLSDQGVRSIQLSPQEDTAAVVYADRVELKSYPAWETQHRISHPDPLKTLFVTNSQLIIAGSRITELVNPAAGTSRVLFLSQIARIGFGSRGEGIRALGPDGRAWEWDGETQTWIALNSEEAGTQAASLDAAEQAFLAEPQVASDSYRVYLEQQASGRYRNMIMLRNVASVGTVPLFNPPKTRFEAFPDRDEPRSPEIFQHGSRIRRRELSLVFNAVDSVEGLAVILNTLAEYGLRGTFFLNGEFMERHPGAVREIADSGHEIGSLFSIYFDMSDSRYQITEQFIKQGLARNEDTFFEITGRELSLLWHAPYYVTNPTILKAGQAMNYQYVGRDVDSLDWVPKRDETGISRLYYPSAELVESVLSRKKPGSILSLRVGKPGDDRPDGGRDDYLFNKLDILLNNILEAGYSVVPVSTLIDNAQ